MIGDWMLRLLYAAASLCDRTKIMLLLAQGCCKPRVSGMGRACQCPHTRQRCVI